MPNINLTNKKTTEFVSPHKSWGSFFEVGLFIVLAVLVYVYLVSPKQKELTDRTTQLNKLTDEENRITNQKKAFDRLVRDLESNKADITVLDQTIPLESRTSKLYILTEYLAQSAGMASSSIAVEGNAESVVAGDRDLIKSPFATERELTAIPITMNAIGTYEQFASFLGLVERSNRLLDISTVGISQGKDNQFIFKLGLVAYAFAPKVMDPAAAPASSIKK